MKPNAVFFALVGAACASALALAVLAAEMHGRRRQRRAWLREAGGSR